jgi:hypothetical protein
MPRRKGRDKKRMESQNEREPARAEILAAVDEAEASLARGEGRAITRESMRELAAEVKRRGRVRLSAGPNSAPKPKP